MYISITQPRWVSLVYCYKDKIYLSRQSSIPFDFILNDDTWHPQIYYWLQMSPTGDMEEKKMSDTKRCDCHNCQHNQINGLLNVLQTMNKQYNVVINKQVKDCYFYLYISTGVVGHLKSCSRGKIKPIIRMIPCIKYTPVLSVGMYLPVLPHSNRKSSCACFANEYSVFSLNFLK